MTESLRAVESPFQKRSVQGTIVTFAVMASFLQSMSCIRLLSSNAHHDPGQALIQLDLNEAEARELALLPRIGPILARRIVENRQQLGPFESVEALTRVHGVGAKTIEEIRHIVIKPTTP